MKKWYVKWGVVKTLQNRRLLTPLETCSVTRDCLEATLTLRREDKYHGKGSIQVECGTRRGWYVQEAWDGASCAYWPGVQVCGGKQGKVRLEEEVELSVMGRH